MKNAEGVCFCLIPQNGCSPLCNARHDCLLELCAHQPKLYSERADLIGVRDNRKRGVGEFGEGGLGRACGR